MSKLPKPQGRWVTGVVTYCYKCERNTFQDVYAELSPRSFVMVAICHCGAEKEIADY